MLHIVRKTLKIALISVCVAVGVPLLLAYTLAGMDSWLGTNTIGPTLYFMFDVVDWHMVGAIACLIALVTLVVMGSLSLPKVGEDPEETAARLSHELTQRL